MKILNRFSAAVLALMLAVSCANVEPEKKEKRPEDRLAFLHRNKMQTSVSGQESAADEQVIPKREKKPVLSPEQMAKLGVDAKPAPAEAELSRTPVKFYEDLIALNGDEELEVSMVFNSAPLLDVLSAFGDLLGFNFSADSALTGTVTLNCNSKMTRRELWNTFDRMLTLAGAGVKVEGSLLRVMANAKLAMQPDQRAGHLAEVYYKQLHNATANEVVRQIRPFLSPGVTCVELSRPNAVMVCDTPENLAKLRQLIEYLDKSGKSGWPRMVLPCNNVLPNKIANELQEVLPVLGLNIYKTTDRNVAPGAVQIVGIDRMRLIIVSAATQEALNMVREWITLLDVAGSDDQENVFVYKVRHNKAAHLARALAVVFETQGTSLTIDATTGRTKTETVNSPVARTNRTSSGRATSRSDVVNANTTNINTDQDSKVYGTTIRVFADGVLNRLVIRCTPRTYASVKALLDKLDVVPAQVLLQVLMVEVTLTESTQFGLEFSGVASKGNTKMLFGTNYANNSSANNTLSPFMTDASGNTVVRTGSNRQDGFTMGLGDSKNPQTQFGYIRAQAGNGQVKVISSPQLLVSSHTEAKINVGQQVPIVTGSVSSTDGGVTDAIEYKETGVGLTVTPYVTSTDLISLDIVQTMSQATANTLSPDLKSPLITQRQIETSMTIANGQTMVLGGLIQERANDTLDSLPIINQIPFLKRLLGSTNASVERTELLVLITGYIVSEHSEIDALVRRYNDAIKALNSYESTLGDNPDADKNRGVLFQDKEFWM